VLGCVVPVRVTPCGRPATADAASGRVVPVRVIPIRRAGNSSCGVGGRGVGLPLPCGGPALAGGVVWPVWWSVYAAMVEQMTCLRWVAARMVMARCWVAVLGAYLAQAKFRGRIWTPVIVPRGSSEVAYGRLWLRPASHPDVRIYPEA
jgi:hypothetical protein